MSKTAPAEAFQTLQYDLRAYSEAIANSMLGDGSQRLWMIPSPLAETSLFKPEDFGKGFDRSEANADYEEAIHREGTMGEAAAARIQVDYAAVQERAFRSRHMTPIRAMVHAAARRAGHGNPAGVHEGVVVQHVADVLRSGKANQ